MCCLCNFFLLRKGQAVSKIWDYFISSVVVVFSVLYSFLFCATCIRLVLVRHFLKQEPCCFSAYIEESNEYILPCTKKKTRHVFVKHGCPRRQQSQNMAKISKSYILTPPHPQGQVMSEKCEEPIGELTVQVWLLYHHPNFKYCTLFVSGTELQTNRQTNGQTDGRSDY